MNIQALAHYRNLREWSHEDWKQLNIHLFIAANFNRYCSVLLKKIGFQHLPSDATESLLGLFCSVGYKPLLSAHQKSIDAVGERRNQIMLGTLKMIAMTRMVDALIQEYPAYISLEHLHHLRKERQRAEHEDYGIRDLPLQDATWSLHANEIPPEELEEQAEEYEQRKSVMLESFRHNLTLNQYQAMRYLLCDHMEINQIANLTGTSLTNIRIMLQNTRRRMHGVLPSDMAAEFADCLHRK